MNNGLQQIAETGDLMHINGAVLRTLNIISGGKCSRSCLENVISNGNPCYLLNSLKYLDSGEYIKQTGNKENPDISLTGKGVRVLQGFLEDDYIEV